MSLKKLHACPNCNKHINTIKYNVTTCSDSISYVLWALKKTNCKVDICFNNYLRVISVSDGNNITGHFVINCNHCDMLFKSVDYKFSNKNKWTKGNVSSPQITEIRLPDGTHASFWDGLNVKKYTWAININGDITISNNNTVPKLIKEIKARKKTSILL